MIDPIHRSVTVHLAPDEAYRLFTTRMESWWPLDTHGRADETDGATTDRLVVEDAAGGRIYEVFSDGTEADWGVVTAWEPPSRVVIDWKPNSEDRPYTEVEVTFTPSDGGTRVDLVHRGWERLGDADGAEWRERYDSGWAHVFDRCFGGAVTA